MNAEWRQGWPVVLAGAVGYGTGGGMLMLLGGLFINPMKVALGWSTSAVTIAPVITLSWAFSYVISGRLIDRIGCRPVAILGGCGLLLCMTLMAVIPIDPLTLFVMAACMGVFASFTAIPTYTRAVATWFDVNVGQAFGMIMSGSAFVAIVATPVTGMMIAEFGWRAGYLCMAGFIGAVGLPATIAFYRERPGALRTAVAAGEDGQDLRQTLRDWRFWVYVVAFGVSSIPLGGLVVHLQPLLAQNGFPLSKAVGLGIIYVVAMTIGKIAIGTLLDRLWPFAVAGSVTIIAGIGALAMMVVDAGMSWAMLVLILGAIGLGHGAESDFLAYFSLHSFGIRAFGAVVSVMAMVTTLGLAAGGFLFARVADQTGSYDIACLIAGCCLVAGGLLLFVVGAAEARGHGPLRPLGT